MEDVIKLSIIILFTGIISSIPGLLFGFWLAKNGFARQSIIPTFVVAICLALVKQIWYGNLSWWYFGILTLLATTIGINRADLWLTFKKGRWWWKLENNNKDS